MDPLSLTASIIAVIGAGGSLVRGLRKLLSLKDAPIWLLQLSNEVSDTSRVVSCIAEHCRVQDRYLTSCEPEASLVCTRLIQARNIVFEVEKLAAYELTKVVSGADRVAPAAWLRSQSKIHDLKDRLEIAKRDLEAIPGLLSLSSMRRLEITVNSVLRQGHMLEDQARTLLQIRDSWPSSCPQSHPQLNQKIPDMEDSSSTMGLPLQDSANAQISQETTYATRYVGDDLCFDISYFEGCESISSCTCHRISQIRSPKMLKFLIGSFSLAYRFVPLAAQQCNTANCRRKAISGSKVRYSFPRWFAHRVVIAIAANERQRGPELWLRVLNRRPGTSEIFRVILSGNMKKVQNLLASGRASVFDVDEAGESILQIAQDAYRNKKEMLKFLLDKGADMMQEDDYGMTSHIEAWKPCIFSANSRDIPYDGLFGTKPDLEQLGWNALQAAVVELGPQTFHSLIDSVPRSSIDEKDRHGRTALSIAAEYADIEKIRLLLQKGADPSTVDKVGRTPLQHLGSRCWGTTVYVLLDLLDVTANVNKADFYGHTAIFYAIHCSDGSVSILEELKNRGANINWPDRHGRTPLHWAIILHPLKTDHIKWFIENGADVNAQDSRCETPLIVALQYRRHQALEVLLEAGSDYTLMASNKISVLHTAAFWGDIRSFGILQKAYLNIKHPQSKGVFNWTPMDIALLRRDNNKEWADWSFEGCDEDPQEWFRVFEAMYKDIEQRSHEFASGDGNEEEGEVETVDELVKALPGSYPND